MPAPILRCALSTLPSPAHIDDTASSARSFWLARARQITMRDGSASLYTGRYGFLAPVFPVPSWACCAHF